MNSREFVTEVTKEIIERGRATYRELYESPTRQAPEIDFYESLNAEQRETFFTMIRNVQIDTLASFLGYLDGDFWLTNQRSDLELHFAGEPTNILNGDLADIFLESADRAG